MNYLDACKPLLSHVAHLSLVAANPHILPEPKNAAQDIGQLVLRAKTALRESDDEARTLVWFAVNSWLAEKLAALPCGKDAAPLLDPLPADAGTLFFHHLHALLRPDAGPRYSRRRIALVEVYAACLELGFLGCFAGRHDRSDWELYRERCRQVLTKTEADTSDAVSAEGGETVLSARTWGGTATMWLFPVAITVALYAIYRTILSQLFHSVVG